MNKDEVSDVFRSEFGFHVAKVYDKKPKRSNPFDHVKRDIVKPREEQNRNAKIKLYLNNIESERQSDRINAIAEGGKC